MKCGGYYYPHCNGQAQGFQHSVYPALHSREIPPPAYYHHCALSPYRHSIPQQPLIDHTKFSPISKKVFLKSRLGVVACLIFDLIAIALLLGAVVAPSYHNSSIAVGPALVLDVYIGLWQVDTFGPHAGLFGPLMPKFVTRAYAKARETLHITSLADLQATACAIDGFLLNAVDTACSTISVLRYVSILLVCVLLSAVLLLLFGVGFLLLYLSSNEKRNSPMIYRALFGFHLIPGILVLMGLLVYLMIGGINASIVPSLGFLVYDARSGTDLGVGFGVALFASIWTMSLPVWFHFIAVELPSYRDYEDLHSGEFTSLM